MFMQVLGPDILFIHRDVLYSVSLCRFDKIQSRILCREFVLDWFDKSDKTKEQGNINFHYIYHTY